MEYSDWETGDILDKWYKEFVPNRPTDDMVLSALKTTAGAIPFPFPDNWQTVGVKRLLRYAAENGYSRIEFARGEDTLNIDGMGLEKGSTNELGRLNSYNGSISFRETKEGQPGDYRIIQADKVGEYTRYSVKFNDDIVKGNENNTYDFFVKNGEKLTESIINEVLWKEYRNTPGSKLYDGRNLTPHVS